MKNTMDFGGEEITWEVVNNTVAKRMVDSSLVHRLVAKRRLKRRTRILNCMIKKMSVHSYSQYIKMKTSVLRHFPHDSDSDDNGSFTDEDYQNIYKSEDSMRKYHMDTSRRSLDLSCMESTDDEYIFLSQPDTSKMQHSLGWQRVIRKKHKSTNVQSNTGNSHRTESRRATSRIRKDLEENSTVGKRKKLLNKIGDKKSVSIQNSIRELFIAKQLCNDNDTLPNEKNAQDMLGANVKIRCDLFDDIPLNERCKNVRTDNKHATEITNTDNSQNKSSEDNTVTEVLPKQSLKQKRSKEKKPDECTTEKHSDTMREKQCELEEELEDSDNDFIPATQSNISIMQESPIWQKVMKKIDKLTKTQSKSGKRHISELQKATSHSKEDTDKNSTTGNKKQLTNKINDKKAVSIQNSIKVSFTTQQSGNDNDALSNDNNTEDISDISLRFHSEEKDDMPLNARGISVHSINTTEFKNADSKQTVKTTNTDDSQNKSSHDKTVKEVLPNNSIEQKSSTERKSDECTTKKHSDAIMEKSCELQKKLEDSDHECIPPTESHMSGIQDSPGNQKEIKKNNKPSKAQSKSGKCHSTESQETASHARKDSDGNSATEKKKKPTKKSSDKTSVTIQNSIKVEFTAEHLSNDNNLLSNEKNAENISDKYSDVSCHFQSQAQDDVVLNESGMNDSSINPSEFRSTDNKETVQITNTSSSQDNSSQENTVKEVLPNAGKKQESSIKRKPDECTIEKPSNTRREKSSKQEEKILSVKKEIPDSAVKQTDENNKENIIEHVSKSNTNEAAENVKKNLMGVFNNFSVISGNKVSEINDSNVNESMDMSKSQLRISDISPLCRSTPMSSERTVPKMQNSISENQPKDSGIDEDSQEESSENGKVKEEAFKRMLIEAIQTTRSPELSESDDSSDLTDQPTMVIDEDRSDREIDDEIDMESTLINDSQVVEDKDPCKQKHQLKVTCTEIVNQKYKIITTKQLNKVKESKEEKEWDHQEENFNDKSKTEGSVADEEEDHRTQELPTKEEKTRTDHEEDSEDPDEFMSATSTKKVQQMRRLDLTADLSSSEDEDQTVCNSQKVAQSTVRKEDTDNSDEEDSTFIIKSENLKNKCKFEKSSTKKQKSPEVIEPRSLNSTVKKAKDVKKNQNVLSTTQNDESFSFSESGSEADTTRKTKSLSAHKSDKPMFETSTLSKIDNHAQKDTNKHAKKATATKSGVSVENDQGQTEVHIPPKPTLKRPYNLQEYVNQEEELELVVDQQFTDFSSHDLSDNELFIMDIPKKLLNSELLGQKITLTKNKLKLGKQRYKAMHKALESVTCVLNSGDVHKPFEPVQLKPVAVIVTQARLDKEAPTIKLPEVVDSETSKTLPSTSGSVSKSVKRKSSGKSHQQQLPKVQFTKGIKKRKLSDSKSLEVFHKKEKKRKKGPVYENES